MTVINTLLAKLKARKDALKEIEELSRRKEYVFLIHYSCESFYELKEGQTPRITSIAVRNYKSGQTQSFSIHKVAELEKVAFDEIEKNYNDLEKVMLKEFFEYLGRHKQHYWIHWNMRNINYGFQALEHRFGILGGSPDYLEDSHKFDLSRKIISLWGSDYIDDPRLEKLAEKNSFFRKDFLKGKEEAKAFNDKEFVKLHQSTLRKVDIMSNILETVFEDTLKTNISLFNYLMLRSVDIIESIMENFIFKLIVIILAITQFLNLLIF
jgi:hypothetical protein